MLRLGIDTGGTNTDAAVLSADNRVLGSAKHTTSADVLSGMQAAVVEALRNASRGKLGCWLTDRPAHAAHLPTASLIPGDFSLRCSHAADPADVGAVMVGTTIFVNAVLQLRDLAQVLRVELVKV